MALSKSLVDKINTNTKKNTDFYDAAEPTKLFRKLRVEGTIELEEINFFGGYRIPSDQFTPSFSQVNQNLVDQRKENVRHSVQRNILLKKFKSGHICFIGPAGMGKSTLLKSIARQVLSKESEGLEEIEIVHFMQCRQYKPGDLLTIREFLFGSALDEEEIKIVMKFVILYPNKILFILDSLDTLRFSADGVYKNITVDEEAGPGAILWNFLSGKVLPNCRIITSSREHSIRNFKGEVRPQKVISLLGFMEETIEQVIAGYVGEEKAKQIFAHLKEKLTVMLTLCNIPVILVYTLIGLDAESDLDTLTMTRIMVFVLQSFLRSPHMLQKDRLGTMYKLEELSHLGNIERRVMFFLPDFDKIGLKPEMATDLAVVAPGRLPQKLMLGGSVMFFTHQTFQEMLGTIWIAGRDVDALEEFVKSCFSLDHFGVIRRFLCGILLDQEVFEAVSDNLLPAVPDVCRKRSILARSLRTSLEQPNIDGERLLEILRDLNESRGGGADLIRATVLKINIQNVSLSTRDIQCIAFAIKHCEHLQSVELLLCGLTDQKLEILSKTLVHSNVKILRLNVSYNAQLGPKGMKMLGGLVRDHGIQELVAAFCDPNSEHIKSLTEGLDDSKLEKLLLGDKRTKPVPGDLISLIHLLSHVERELNLEGWKIEEQDQELLRYILTGKSVSIILSDRILLDTTTERYSISDDSSSEYLTAESGSDSETDFQEDTRSETHPGDLVRHWPSRFRHRADGTEVVPITGNRQPSSDSPRPRMPYAVYYNYMHNENVTVRRDFYAGCDNNMIDNRREEHPTINVYCAVM